MNSQIQVIVQFKTCLKIGESSRSWVSSLSFLLSLQCTNKKSKDIYIGWQFVRIFHSLLPSSAKEDEDSREGSESQSHNIDESCYYVDKSLIHDIIPQPGGGNEPIDSWMCLLNTVGWVNE